MFTELLVRVVILVRDGTTVETGLPKGPLDRINVLTEGRRLVDLKERSSVVAALKTYKLFRAYADRTDVEARDAMKLIVEGEIEICRTQTH